MLDIDHTDLDIAHFTLFHNHGEHLCQVKLKSVYACISFAPVLLFQMTSKCYLDLSPRELVHAHDTVPHSGQQFCEVSLKKPPFVKEICSGKYMDIKLSSVPLTFFT
jgi:hypothetical protein